LWVQGDNTDDEQIDEWKSMGLLPKTFSLGHQSNLITLCRNCHSQYDGPYPSWFALPEDLDFFIDFEKDDYAKRIAAAERGVKQERALPEVLLLPFFI
jgi:hypothetical protein